MHDELLLRYRCDRDPRAYAALVDAYRPLVYSVCRRYLREPADVEDAVQETFLKLAENAHAIRDSLAGWLSSTAYTTSNLLIRRAIRERRRREALGHLPRPADGDAEYHLVHEAIRLRLHEALLVLDEPSRDLVVRRFFRKVPLRVIAGETGTSVATACRRVSSALADLADVLRDMGVSAADELTLAEHFGDPGNLVAADGGADFDSLRFAPDWNRPDSPFATPTTEPEDDACLAGDAGRRFLPGWSRSIRVGVLISYASSNVPGVRGGYHPGNYHPVELQAHLARLISHPGIRLVGIAEPGTGQCGPVERTLRQYELTGGLVDATDALGLASLDVILVGINYIMSPGVGRAIVDAVSAAGTGLLNEWWTGGRSGRVDPYVRQLMLADSIAVAYHTPHQCGAPLPATVLETHSVLPGLATGTSIPVNGCGVVYRPLGGTRVLVAKDHVVTPAEHNIPGFGPARMPVCLVGRLGRGRAFVLNNPYTDLLPACPAIGTPDGLANILAWLAEPRREAA